MYCIVCGWVDGYPGVTLWCFRVSWHRHMPSNSSELSQFWAKFCCLIFLDMNIQHNNVPAIFLSKTSFEDWVLKWSTAVLNILVVFTCTWQNLQSWIEEMAVTSHFNPCKIIFPTVAGERGWFCTGLASGGVGWGRWECGDTYQSRKETCARCMFFFLKHWSWCLLIYCNVEHISIFEINPGNIKKSYEKLDQIGLGRGKWYFRMAFGTFPLLKSDWANSFFIGFIFFYW